VFGPAPIRAGAGNSPRGSFVGDNSRQEVSVALSLPKAKSLANRLRSQGNSGERNFLVRYSTSGLLPTGDLSTEIFIEYIGYLRGMLVGGKLF
jgi:hypothetical protein